MEVELLKALPAGSGNFAAYLALIIVFIGFIKYLLDKYEQRFADLSKSHADELATARTAFQDQVKFLTDRIFAISESTTNAIRSLENAFREMKERVK